jgi:hypothetical protein
MSDQTKAAIAEGSDRAAIDMLPAESMALTVALAQVLRGEAPQRGTAAVCVLALARLTGRHDWTEEADRG